MQSWGKADNELSSNHLQYSPDGLVWLELLG
jgi:hypothetical protein